MLNLVWKFKFQKVAEASAANQAAASTSNCYYFAHLLIFAMNWGESYHLRRLIKTRVIQVEWISSVLNLKWFWDLIQVEQSWQWSLFGYTGWYSSWLRPFLDWKQTTTIFKTTNSKIYFEMKKIENKNSCHKSGTCCGVTGSAKCTVGCCSTEVLFVFCVSPFPCQASLAVSHCPSSSAASAADTLVRDAGKGSILDGTGGGGLNARLSCRIWPRLSRLHHFFAAYVNGA